MFENIKDALRVFKPRPEDRIDRILEKLGKAWHKTPDLRLGQLLINIDSALEKHLFYTEDAQFEEFLDHWIKLLEDKHGRMAQG